MDSSGMGSFLQESVGHGEVLIVSKLGDVIKKLKFSKLGQYMCTAGETDLNKGKNSKERKRSM